MTDWEIYPPASFTLDPQTGLHNVYFECSTMLCRRPQDPVPSMTHCRIMWAAIQLYMRHMPLQSPERILVSIDNPWVGKGGFCVRMQTFTLTGEGWTFWPRWKDHTLLTLTTREIMGILRS